MKIRQETDLQQKKIGSICLWLLGLYVLLGVAFFFLGGHQIQYRASAGNVAMPAAESAPVALTDGVVVEQRFTADIDVVQSLALQWSAFYRDNTGQVTLELLREDTGDTVLTQTVDAAQIQEGGVVTMTADSGLLYLRGVPLCLRLTATSSEGEAVAPLVSSDVPEGFSLSVNGQPMAGQLCLSVSGEDRIWTGLYYWQLMAAFGALWALVLAWEYLRWRAGKWTLLAYALGVFDRYRFLMRQLVSRDFKAKYKRSVLGVFWSFLNPLMTMLVQYVVFSNIFRFNIANYPVYLMCGNVIFAYFTESCGMSLGSIIGNASLITKVYVPKYIYPLTRIISSLINLVISLIPLVGAVLLSGLWPTKAYLLIPYALVTLALFCLGMGLFLAAATVFFRDVQFLWNILTTIWTYFTPIFYSVEFLPPWLQNVMQLNPMYHYITFLRTCVMDGVSPEPRAYLACLGFALLALLVGGFVFKKTQDRFALYL